MSKTHIVTLDNSALIGLLRNAAAVKAFPAFKNIAKQLKTKTRGCGRCGRGKAKDAVANSVKQLIGGWPTTNKQTLKKLLGVDRIRMVIDKKVKEF